MAGATIKSSRQSIFADVTARLIHELEQGRLPWVQPWDTG
jgi:antirestriction protein ArdC